MSPGVATTRAASSVASVAAALAGAPADLVRRFRPSEQQTRRSTRYGPTKPADVAKLGPSPCTVEDAAEAGRIADAATLSLKEQRLVKMSEVRS